MDPLSVASGVVTFLGTVMEVAAALKAIRNDKPESVIVLSFRTLQAERIESLQQELLRLSQERRDLVVPNNQAGTEAHTDFEERRSELNNYIDSNLHVYGM